MANHSSAKKAIRKTQRNAAINKNRMSRIRTFVKKVLAAVASGASNEARDALVVAQSELMRGVSSKLIKKNTASRKVSRLSKLVKNISDAVSVPKVVKEKPKAEVQVKAEKVVKTTKAATKKVASKKEESTAKKATKKKAE